MNKVRNWPRITIYFYQGSKVKFVKETARNQRLIASSMAGISRRQAILQTLSINSNDRIMDVGCGAGHLVEQLAKATSGQGQVYALDPSEDQLAEARDRCSDLSNIIFLHGSADNIDLESGVCDIVTSTQAYEYIEDIDAALLESTRILRSGGSFVNVSILWDYFRFYGPDETLNNLVHDAFKEHCYHQMLPMELPGKLRGLGYKYIKNESLAFMVSDRDQNSPARYLETMMANFAVTHGVSKKDVEDWRVQLTEAEVEGRFGFTSYPVLTSAYLS